jgi:hemerythrin superfamily protein
LNSKGRADIASWELTLGISLARSAVTECVSNWEETMPRPKTKPRAAEKDALTLLKDHDTVRELLSELEEAEGKKRLATLRNIEQELKVHTKIEEDIFYPAFREASEKEEDTELYFEALVEHHAEEEEKQMFPRPRRLMGKRATSRARAAAS